MSKTHQITDLILSCFPKHDEIPSYWDSLKHLEMITQLEQQLNCKFSLQEIIETHNNLSLLIKKIEEKSCP